MARINMTLPNGVPFRTSSQRRYVLARTFRGSADILKRSDSHATIMAEYNGRMDTAENGAGSTSIRRSFVIDTVTGEVIAKRGPDEFVWV